MGADVLADHHDADAGMVLSQRRGLPYSLVGVGRRHADVRDHDVGPVLVDGLEERPQVGAVLGDLDLLRVLLERAAQPFPDEEGVLRDHHAVHRLVLDARHTRRRWFLTGSGAWPVTRPSTVAPSPGSDRMT